MRLPCVQEDFANSVLAMRVGAMNERRIGDSADPAKNVGPLIDGTAFEHITQQLAALPNDAHILHQVSLGLVAQGGHIFAPALTNLPGVRHLTREIFGPVFHMVRLVRKTLGAWACALARSAKDRDRLSLPRQALSAASDRLSRRYPCGGEEPANHDGCIATLQGLGAGSMPFIHHAQTRSGTS